MKKLIFLSVLLALITLSPNAHAMDLSNYGIKESSFKEAMYSTDMTAPFNAETISEQVNLYTGQLELNVTDLVLPGKNGFDVVINRSYRSQADGKNYYFLNSNERNYAWGYITATSYTDSRGRIYLVAFNTEDDCIEVGETIDIDVSVSTKINRNNYYFYKTGTIKDGNKLTVTRVEGAEVFIVDYEYQCNDATIDMDDVYSSSLISQGWDFEIPRGTHSTKIYEDREDEYREYTNIIRDYDGNLLNLLWETKKRNGEWLPSYCTVENATGYTCEFLSYNDITENGISYNKIITAPDGKKTYVDKRGYVVACADKFGNMIRFPTRTTIIDTMGRRITCNSQGITYTDPNGENEHKIIFNYEEVPSPAGANFSSGGKTILVVNYENGNTVKYHHDIKYASYYPRNYSRLDTCGTGKSIYVNNLEKIEYPNGDCKFFEYEKRVLYMIEKGKKERHLVTKSYEIIGGEEKNRYEYTYNNKYMGKLQNNGLSSVDGVATRVADGFTIKETYTKSNNFLKSRREEGDKSIEYGYSTYSYKPMIKSLYSYNGIHNSRKIYTYTFGTRRLESETDGYSTINYTYDPTYEMILTKTYLANDNLSVRLQNTLSEDKKTVVCTEVFANDVLKAKAFYTYDENGNVIKQRIWGDDKNGNGICDENELDELNCDYVYNSDGTFSVERYINGVYDADNNISGKISTKYDYDLTGNPFKFTDAKGNIYNYTYSITGKPQSIQNPDNTTASLSYNYQSNTTEFTNENGEKVKQTYDCCGNPLEKYVYKNQAWTLVEKNSYNNFSLLLTNTTYSGYNVVNSVTEYTYDSNDRLKSVKIKDANGTVLSEKNYTYSGGNINNTYCRTVTETTVADGGSLTAKKYYDYIGGRIIGEEVSDGTTVKTTLYTYDKVGNIVSKTMPNGNVINYEYDYSGNLIKETNSLIEYPTENVYDPKGRLKKTIAKTTDGVSSVTEYKYDALDRLIKESGAITQKTYYDQNGNTTKTVLGTMTPTITQYEYNSRNKPIKTILGTAPDVPIVTSYTYDSVGNVTSSAVGADENDAGHVTSYEYNELGQLVKLTDANGNSETYTYDLNGNLLTRKDRKGNITTNTYTPLGQLKKSQTAEETVNYSYNRLGNLIAVNNENVSITYGYDLFGRKTSEFVTDQTDYSFNNYAYDISDNLTSYTMSKNGVQQISSAYTYDSLNRLTSFNGKTRTYFGNGALQSYGDETYEYDEYNRRYKIIKNGDIISETYYTNNGYVGGKFQDSRLIDYYHSTTGALMYEAEIFAESIPRKNYKYDKYGNRTQITEDDDYTSSPEQTIASYTYDNLNRLTHEEKDGKRYSYTYDQNGNLTTKTVDSEANGASLSLLDNMPESAIYEYDQNNKLKKVTTADTIAAYSYLPDGRRASKTVNGVKTSHIWDGNNIVADTKNGILTKYIRSNKLEQAVTGDNIQNYTVDSRGDVIDFGNTDYFYDAFGNVQTETNPNPFGYCGEYFDQETGFIYLRNRYYNPTIGRFTQEDPIRDGSNWYAYCANNPTSFVDPLGLKYLIAWSYSKAELKPYIDSNGNINWGKFTRENSFSRAATTRKQELLDMGIPEKDIDVQRIDNKDDMKKTWEMWSDYDVIEGLDIYSHGDSEGIIVAGGGGRFLSKAKKLKWGSVLRSRIINGKSTTIIDNPYAVFHGCNTANGEFAQKFANSQEVTTYAQVGYASFSKNPNVHIPIEENATSGKVYLYHFDWFNFKNTYGRGKVFYKQ